MPVCHKRKLAFCHIPRTGGVSVSNALQMEVKDKHFPVSWYRKEFPDYKIFTIYRNYEDRIQSTFGWKLSDDVSEHIMRVGVQNIGLMIKPNDYFLDVQPDFILRFTHLQDDLNKMLTSLNFEPITLVACNSFRQ